VVNDRKTLVFAALLPFLFASLVLTGAAWAHDDPSSDGLIDGGGSYKTDCVSKFQTGLELNYPAAPKKSKELRCIDGDLSCDADGAVDGSCTFNVGLCLADDEETTLCLPAGVPVGGVVVKNKPLGHKKYDADLQALQEEVDALLDPTGVPCDDPGAGGGNCFTCTDSQVAMTAPLSVKKGKKKVKVKVITEPGGVKNKPIKDNDKLKLRCIECEAASTFEHIADIVFKTGCAASGVCHTGPTAGAGMNLDPDQAGGLDALYDELTVEAAGSLGAGALGMERVLPGDPNLGTAASASLIYEKLLRTTSELDQLCTDGGQLAGCLGTNMPPGSDLYSTGKLALLQTWIEAGAPRDGWVAGASCGDPEDIWVPIDPPAAPAPGEGFQVHMPAPAGFTVEPGTEFEGCQWIEMPAEITDTWYIERVELYANSGTHHVILWETTNSASGYGTSFDPGDSLCRKKQSEFGVPFSFRIGFQDALTELQLPANVSYAMDPGKVFGFNPHYTNPFNVPIYPEVWVNFYGSTTPSVVEGEDIFPGDLGFQIPPGTKGTGNLTSYTNSTGVGQCYYSLGSHSHRRNTGFKIWTSQPSGWTDTNDLIYYNTDWDHPAVIEPSPRLHLAPGEKMWFQCEWDNGVLNDVNRRCRVLGENGAGPDQCGFLNDRVCFTDADCPLGPTYGVCRDCNIDFGFLAEDEMCFLPGLYYDEQPGPDPCPY
jgi:hypothetical protein